MTTPDGPSCVTCKATEARCARVAGCCDACTHLFGEYDAPGCTICDAPINRTGGRRPARCADCQAEHGKTGQLPIAPCGTPAAYRRHHYHGEKPCSACTEAEARRYLDRREVSA